MLTGTLRVFVRRAARTAAPFGLLVAAVVPAAQAQELEPRTLANVPVGVNFLAVGYVYSSGNVLLDPALPVEDLDAKIDILLLRYVRTVGLGGRAAKVKVLVPHTAGDWKGSVEGTPRTRSTTGLGDLQVELEVGFSGAPALDREGFAGYKQRTIVGASLRIVLPTGEYQPSRFLNLGSNRWAFRPEIGVSRAMGRWTLETAGAVWLFTDNDDFLAGSKLSQDPLYVVKLHGIRSFRPGLWVAVGCGYGRGGRIEIDGVPRDTLQSNWRFGAVAAYPITSSQGLSVRVGTGINDGAGADFDVFAVSYQYAWGGN